ncbi:MAG: glycosyltransferase family 39 protein [Cyanobacteria bacterium P01_H01_bin.15]
MRLSKIFSPGWLDGLILAGCLGSLLWGLSAYGLYEPHEGHFAGVAYEMLLRQDWVTPALNGVPYLNKPPFVYWLIATSYRLFGVSEWSARLPIGMSAWWAGLIVWQWSRQLWNRHAGRYATLSLTFTAGWLIFARQLLIDVVLGALLITAYYALWQTLRSTQTRPQPWRILFFCLLGLTFLTKGLLGPVVLTLMIGCAWWELRSQKSRDFWFRLKPIQGIFVTLAVLLPWSWAIAQAQPGFWKYFWFNEHWQRLFDQRWPPDYVVSQVNIWGYLGITAAWFLPWTFLLWPIFRQVHWHWQSQTSSQSKPEFSDRKLALTLLTVGTVLPVLLFLPVSARLLYYSLLALPPLAILTGGWWSEAQSELKPWGTCYGLAGLFILALGVFCLPSLAEALVEDPSFVVEMGRGISVVLACSFLGAAYSFFRNQRQAAFLALTVGFMGMNIAIVKGFSQLQPMRSSRELIQTVSTCLDQEILWIAEGSRELGSVGAVGFYLNQPYFLQTLPATMNIGWVDPPHGQPYRQVLVLADAGPTRQLPEFPGPPPSYAISRSELNQYWRSRQPVIFLTDFQRNLTDPSDALEINLPEDAGVPLTQLGTRFVYGNDAARSYWKSKKCTQ